MANVEILPQVASYVKKLTFMGTHEFETKLIGNASKFTVEKEE